MSTEPNAYLRNAVLQATPEQLQLMLYDGAIRFALQGRQAIEKKDYENIYDKLSRAQRIVLEMQSGLRPEVNEELCGRMASVYNFIYRKLVSGSINRNVKDIDEAVEILRIERETWMMLLDKVNAERGGGAPQGQASGDATDASDVSSISFQG